MSKARYGSALQTCSCTSDTYEHSLRVALLSVDLGYENGLEGADLRTLGLAGLLHDMGKREIDEAILSGTSPLSEDERSAMDEHPRRGARLLEEDLYTKVRQIVVGTTSTIRLLSPDKARIAEL